MILDELIELVSLDLIEGTIEAVVVLDALIKYVLEDGLRLPGALSVGKPSPFH